MAILKDYDLGFTTLNYLAIDKDHPYSSRPTDIYQEAVDAVLATDDTPEIPAIPEITGLFHVRYNICADKVHNDAKQYANCDFVDVPIDGFYALMTANNNDTLGCLYAMIKQLPGWAEATDVLEDGQEAISLA